MEAEARERGWIVLSETLTPGLLERLEREHAGASPTHCPYLREHLEGLDG